MKGRRALLLQAFILLWRATFLNAEDPIPSAWQCGAYQLASIAKFTSSICMDESFKRGLSLPELAPAKAPLKIEIQTWKSQQIATLIAAILAKDIFSYDVKLTCGSSGFEALKRLDERHSDVLLEFWSETYEQDVENYILRKVSVVDAGSIGYIGRSGVFLTPYTGKNYSESLDLGSFSYENFVSTFASFWGTSLTVPQVQRIYSAQNDTEIVGTLAARGYTIQNRFTPEWCNEWSPDGAGNTCIDIKAEVEDYDRGQLQQFIRNRRLNVTVSFWGIAGLEAYVDAKMKRTEPCMFKYWTPTQFISRTGVERMTLPPYTQECFANNTASIQGYGSVDCDFPSTQLKKVVRKEVLVSDVYSKYHGVSTLLRRLEISDPEMNAMLVEIFDPSFDEFDVACHWVRNNTEKWINMVEPFQCSPGTILTEGGCKTEEVANKEAYLYSIMVVVPIAAVVFYCTIKRKGDEFAHLMAEMLQESTKLVTAMIGDMVDFGTDLFAFVYILETPALQPFVIPYTVFVGIGGLVSLADIWAGGMTIYSLLWKKETRYDIFGRFTLGYETKAVTLGGESNIFVEVSDRHQLAFHLNRATHYVKLALIQLAILCIKDLPFFIINFFIIVHTKSVNFPILLSLAFNCVKLGTATSTCNILVYNLETRQKLMKLVNKHDAMQPEAKTWKKKEPGSHQSIMLERRKRSSTNHSIHSASPRTGQDQDSVLLAKSHNVHSSAASKDQIRVGLDSSTGFGGGGGRAREGGRRGLMDNKDDDHTARSDHPFYPSPSTPGRGGALCLSPNSGVHLQHNFHRRSSPQHHHQVDEIESKRYWREAQEGENALEAKLQDVLVQIGGQLDALNTALMSTGNEDTKGDIRNHIGALQKREQFYLDQIQKAKANTKQKYDVYLQDKIRRGKSVDNAITNGGMKIKVRESPSSPVQERKQNNQEYGTETALAASSSDAVLSFSFANNSTLPVKRTSTANATSPNNQKSRRGKGTRNTHTTKGESAGEDKNESHFFRSNSSNSDKKLQIPAPKFQKLTPETGARPTPSKHSETMSTLSIYM